MKNKNKPIEVKSINNTLTKWYKKLGWGKPSVKAMTIDYKDCPTKKEKSDHIHNWVSDSVLAFNQKCGQCGTIRAFTLASQDKTDKLQPYIDRVVAALGHKEALVTDESYVSDFLTIYFEGNLKMKNIREKELQKACKKLKIEINKNELITDVAKRLMKHERQRKNP